jgi:hypothetical protein
MKLGLSQSVLRISQPKRDKVIPNWRKVHNVDLHNLYQYPNTVRAMKARRVNWEGNVSTIGGRHIQSFSRKN